MDTTIDQSTRDRLVKLAIRAGLANSQVEEIVAGADSNRLVVIFDDGIDAANTNHASQDVDACYEAMKILGLW